MDTKVFESLARNQFQVCSLQSTPKQLVVEATFPFEFAPAPRFYYSVYLLY